ncbi:MAG: GreA/GreB family elongation factor [Arcobacteraceae bacterium]|nr:GreA/GreB family elongation factor [Arcobacteraceae bacterium]
MKIVPNQKPITSIAIEIFRDEFKQKQIERHFWVDEKEKAAALGDRSENAEYISAKEMIRNLDKRLRFLQSMIQNARVINPNDIPNNDLRFGKKVIFEDGSFLSLVGSYEISIFVNAVSVYAPIGKQLLGKKIGENLTLNNKKNRIIQIQSLCSDDIQTHL